MKITTIINGILKKREESELINCEKVVLEN